MSKVVTSENDPDKPRIARDDVAAFFEQRAGKAESLGLVRAVIYQDKHADLAERRDRAEKERILPLLALDGTQRILDVGCGTGRWTGELIQHVAHYHGVDFSAGLIGHARKQHRETRDLRFSIASADSYSLQSLRESEAFDRVLCCGVMIYLNDDELLTAIRCMGNVAASSARIVLREPMGVKSRLTILQHYSDELEQSYNAIYRTQSEIECLLTATLAPSGFRVSGSGDVYLEGSLNNRAETRQRWIVLERP